MCAACVCVCVRKRDTKRVRAWVSQAIVPENLTWTQDILKTFMQQWSDKQNAVIGKKAQVCVCMCLHSQNPCNIQILYLSALSCVTQYIVHSYNAFTSPRICTSWACTHSMGAACHLPWTLQSHFRTEGTMLHDFTKQNRLCYIMRPLPQLLPDMLTRGAEMGRLK